MTTYTFLPPTANDVPAVLPETRGVQFGLFRHYGTRARGENVWQLVDGTYTTTQPFPTVSVVDAQTQASNDVATYRKVFWGGHVYDAVEEAEAIALQAAGVATLGVNLFPTPLAPPTNVLLASGNRFLFLKPGDDSVITTFAPAPAAPTEDFVMTSDGFVLFLAGTGQNDALIVDP